jgi:hypothetical protein
MPSDAQRPQKLTDTQRSILVALARPYGGGSPYATPAPNRQIADEVHLGVDAVKRHLRILSERFGLGDLPQNEKRAKLVEAVLESGLITLRELESPPS